MRLWRVKVALLFICCCVIPAAWSQIHKVMINFFYACTEAPLTEYERLRAQTMMRNNQVLRSLGVTTWLQLSTVKCKEKGSSSWRLWFFVWTPRYRGRRRWCGRSGIFNQIYFSFIACISLVYFAFRLVISVLCHKQFWCLMFWFRNIVCLWLNCFCKFSLGFVP